MFLLVLAVVVSALISSRPSLGGNSTRHFRVQEYHLIGKDLRSRSLGDAYYQKRSLPIERAHCGLSVSTMLCYANKHVCSRIPYGVLVVCARADEVYGGYETGRR